MRATRRACTVTGATARPVASALRQAQQVKNPPGGGPGGFFLKRSASGRLEVKTAALRVGEEGCELGPAHDVSATLGALAVADRYHLVEVGSHLHTSAVVLTAVGLPPCRAKQVCHGSTPSVVRVV